MITTNWRHLPPVLAVLVAGFACNPSNTPRITRNRDGQVLSHYQLQSATGARNGDKLTSHVVFTAPNSTLVLQMRFQIGVPTRLETGTYTWKQGKDTTTGFVRSNAVTFLGGQDGPPSLGGTFQLVSEGISLYEVRLPSTALSNSAPSPTDPAAVPAPAR